MNAPVRLVVCAGAVACLVATRMVQLDVRPASAQERATQDQQAATFRAEANYVRVDVFPTLNDVPVTDLRADEFEIVEDKAPQKIEQFEHVVIRGPVPQEQRREPNSAAESRQAVADTRARVFVLFLDTYHVEFESSYRIRKPITDALDRLIGADDLVAVMTPEMSARDITFARKTTTIDGMLRRHSDWGERGRMLSRDPQDETYRTCYPGFGPTPQCQNDDRGVAEELINRRHEKLTLDALQDLVRVLRGLREERKAILAISDGWLLFRRSTSLTRQLGCSTPSLPPVRVDPLGGKLTTKLPEGTVDTQNICDVDRMRLANIDSEEQFREILDEANRANASFYPIDPRGLVVFDEPIARPGGLAELAPPLPPFEDSRRTQSRGASLRQLASLTDGLAVVGSNDLAAGLRRVVTDLSSYYLLGYYSTGKLDGKFHGITVRVKRPGVKVRARRGYLAPTTAEVSRAAAPAPAPAMPAAELAMATSAAAAVAKLPAAVRDQPFRAYVMAGWRPGDRSTAATFWTVGEVADRIPGAEIEATVMNAAGEIVGTARGQIVPGTTSVLVPVVPNRAVEPGDYMVRVRSQTPSGSETATVRVSLAPPPHGSGAVFVRRGQSTGNKEAPTADLRFRRSDTLRVDVPVPDVAVVSSRLLDRTGKAIPVPVAAAVREDPDGSRWATARVALVPLAPGDYVIDVTANDTRTLVAFRVIP